MIMKTQKLALWGMTALLIGSMFAPLTALGDDSRQKNKNNWRNGAIAGGVIAGYGLLKGNKTATILGAAGAAYSANRYEQERKSQDARKHARARYHRSHGNYYQNGRKYYKYRGKMYYKDMKTGARHRVG
jgi:uncharacterized protein YcfJ